MHDVGFLRDLAIVMIVAGIVTIVFHRLKQPVVLGYILAGVIIGPHTPPHTLLHGEESIKTLAELGVVFLMFSLGMEFSFKKLKRVGVTALIAALLEILLMVWVGYQIGRGFGWKAMDCLFLGAMLSISSTTIIVKALSELGRTKEKFAELIFGILIVEDLLAIVMIALLSGMAQTGELEIRSVVVTTMRLLIFLTVSVVLGLLFVPRLLRYVSGFKSNEMLLITVLGLCFGVSLLAVQLEYSVALGAFVIGAVIAEAREIHRIEALMEPVRDMFSAVFFVAIGLLIDPGVLVKYWLPVLVITVAVIVGKVITCSFGAFVAGNDMRTSMRVGMGLAQIGEFSFIIAALGLQLKVTSEFLYPIAVTVSAITTLSTPYLVRSSDAFVNWFDRVAPTKWVNSLSQYTNWVGKLSSGDSSRNMAAQLTRRWFWQIALNIALVAGIFIGATFMAQSRPSWAPSFANDEEVAKAAWWFIAAVLSLPCLVASYRKLQALGLLIGERIVMRHPNATGAQNFLARAIPLIGVIDMGLLILILSSGLLSDWKTGLILVTIIAAITALLWTRLIRIYSKAQIAIKDTLDEAPAPLHDAPPPKLANLFKEADIAPVVVHPNSAARGKLISELGLRSRTGASIVAIERNGNTIVNPGAHEEFLAHDQVLLLGKPSDLEAARKDFEAPVG